VPRGEVLLLPATEAGFRTQLDAVAATGNRAVAEASPWLQASIGRLPPELAARLRLCADWTRQTAVDSVLVEGDRARMTEVLRVVAGFAGPIVPVQGTADIDLGMLVHELAISINTAAAGGNASLMALREN
jgi:RHH-type proline utilization regulon transcriptional repressor/proline dehydrogenase/delta 1-pyrroline-5-carboxylate dehydrogenase